jgi:peptidylprolyl isomerase
MSDRNLFINSLVGGAIIVGIAGYLYVNRSFAGGGEAADTPNPNLVIEVAGEASGRIVIDLDMAHAPNHAVRLIELAQKGAYDGVVFHRVIDGFMAQTGDVQFGRAGDDLSAAGTGGSDLPDLRAEFSDQPFVRGTVGMARSSDPDSANSQFFIMFAPSDNLNGKYTVVGHVVSGMDVVDRIKKGDEIANGAVAGEPDRMVKVTVEK